MRETRHASAAFAFLLTGKRGVGRRQLAKIASVVMDVDEDVDVGKGISQVSHWDVTIH
jgi:hypothetical protein